MALRKTMTFTAECFCQTSIGVIEMGEKTVDLPDAYIKITKVDGGKDGARIYVSITSGTSTLKANYGFRPSVEEGSENFIRQGYEYLKTLPEFAGATDC